ncbi:MAG: helix-turn-helix domain-containing protein [Chloroflexi bacterium]|nr:helix-turn-helix domain-containing protein [Chloroflexota bacterium]
MTTALTQDYVTVAEAAALLKVSQPTIWRWIDQGRLPAYRIGEKRVRINRADLPRLITPVGKTGQKGGAMAQTERLTQGPLTVKEQRRALKAVQDAQRLQAEMLAQRGGKLFAPSYSILDELRDERTRNLS